MEYSELNETNLETILKSLDFDEGEIARIQKDREYFDRYILIQDGPDIGFLTVLRQPFGDPYLDLTLEECDLLNYRGRLSVESFLDVMDNIFEIPQIARCCESAKEAFMRRGFKDIEEKPEYDGSSKLIPVNFQVSLEISEPETVSNIRQMNLEDISYISNLFFDEYTARFRLVEKMYKTDPQSCFVYEDGGEIKGAVFAERLNDRLYIHQIFVKKSERGKKIDRNLLDYIVTYARDFDYHLVGGTIRGNLSRYYYRFGVRVDESVEEEGYMVRFDINKFR